MMSTSALWWILFGIFIRQDISAEVGNTVKLPCNTTFDEPVDWRYQKDATVDEEYVCTATNQGVTRCDHYFKWPRIHVTVSTPGDYTLTIDNASVSDSGLYHCVEQQAAGMRHTLKLNVTESDCLRNSCQNNGTCIGGKNSYNCSCSYGFTGNNCETTQLDSKKNTGTLVIVIVCVAVGVCVGVIIFGCRRRNCQNQHRNDEEPAVVRPPTLLFTVKGQKRLSGVTILNNKLYVIYHESVTVDVYSMQQHSYTLIHEIHIDGLEHSNCIAISKCSNCLYIVDSGLGVWRVKADHQGHQVDKWMNIKNVATISVSTRGKITMLIVVNCQGQPPNHIWYGQLRVYKPDKKFWKSVELSQELVNPYHALQTANNSFIVSHGNDKTELNRVCEVNVHGDVINSYGESCGARCEQLNTPQHIALYDNERILVADYNNRRVLLLKRNLIIEQVLLSWTDDWPERVFYNSETQQLLAGLQLGDVEVYSVQ